MSRDPTPPQVRATVVASLGRPATDGYEAAVVLETWRGLPVGTALAAAARLELRIIDLTASEPPKERPAAAALEDGAPAAHGAGHALYGPPDLPIASADQARRTHRQIEQLGDRIARALRDSER